MDFSQQNRLRIGLQSLMLLQVRISVRIYIYPRGVKFSQEYCLVQALVLELELWMLFHCVMYKFKLSWMSSVICVAPNFCHVIWKLLQNGTKSQHLYRTHYLWCSLRVAFFVIFPIVFISNDKNVAPHKGPRTLQRFSQRFFWKNLCKNLCPYIKLLRKSLQLWKKKL